MSVRDFIESNYRHFNSGALANCASSLRSFLEQDGRLMVTLAGAMSTAEIGRTLAPAIKAQRVHAICCKMQSTLDLRHVDKGSKGF